MLNADPWFELGDSAPFTPPDWEYPLASQDGYRQNLALIRAASLAHDIPFWNYFNTVPFDSHRDPTFGELCWQVFTSMTFGARGILYFTYWDDPDSTLCECNAKPALFEFGPRLTLSG